jgi:hypothetical protein
MRAVYLIGIGQTAVSKNGGVRGRYSVADAIEQAIIMRVLIHSTSICWSSGT